MGARVLMGLVGILYAIVGFNIVADPLQGAVALTIVIAIVLIVEGIIRLFAAFNEATPQRGLVAVLAVINILLGLWLWSGIRRLAWRSASSSASSCCLPASS